jgi:hypothetical protein
MTIMRGETMNALIGTRHVCNITYPTLDETLQGSPPAIPAAEPGTSQVIYTVSAVTHLPSLDAAVTYVNGGWIIVSGKNLTASNRTISWRILKNTASLATGTATCIASQYWTLNLVNAGLTGLVAGDVVEARLWCADVTWLDWRYNCFAVMPTRIKLFNDARRLAFNIKYYTNGATAYPVPTLGVPLAATMTPHRLYGLIYGNTARTLIPTINDWSTFMQAEDTTGGICTIYYGDAYVTVAISCDATKYPVYGNNAKVASISWNELDMRI